MGAEKRAARLVKQYERCKITKEELRKHLGKGVLGRITGIIGPFVLRYQNGKLVISERAIIYNKSMSEASVEVRNNFSGKVRFAQFLYNIKEIQQIWSKADIGGRRAWNRIIKYNNIKGNHPTTNNIILPEKHQLDSDVVCTLTEDFEIDIKGDRHSLQTDDRLIIVLVPYQPADARDEYFEMIQVEGNTLTYDQIKTCSRYKKYIIYTAVVSANGDTWSNTNAVEGSFADKKAEVDESFVLYWLLLIQGFLTLVSSQEITFVKRRRLYQLKL